MEDSFVYVGLIDADSVPGYLEAIAQSVRERTLILASGAQQFIAWPADLVRVRVEAARTEETVNLTIKLSWTEDAAANGGGSALRVGSCEL